MIAQWIHTALVYIEHNPSYGYLFSFIISFLESLPIIGTIVPGSITMTAVGTLIGTGTLPLIPTFGSAIIGAFLGDFLGFLVGRLGEERIFKIWPFKHHRNWLDYGRKFFHKHGVKSVIIGRFIGPLRSAIPMIASLLGMSYFRFIIAGICSATLWSLLYILPGYLLGKYSKHLTHAELARWMAYIIAIIGILALIYIMYKSTAWIYRKYFQHKTEFFWQCLSTQYQALNWFNLTDNPIQCTPLLLFIWLIILSVLIFTLHLCKPFCHIEFLHQHPAVVHYIERNHVFHQLSIFSDWNSLTIFVFFSLLITSTTIIGIVKSLKCFLIYLAIYLCLKYITHEDYYLQQLIFENYFLWLPLAYFSFTKKTFYTKYYTSIYCIYGAFTLMVNGYTIILGHVEIYSWIQSWIVSSMAITLYCMFSYRMKNKHSQNTLDSIAIHVPFYLIICSYLLFFLS